jgi:Protein of unknown function (DUF2628)
MLLRLLLGRDRLQSYTVHEPNPPPLDRVDRADALMFVKDGFLFQAALFAPFWLAAKNLWLALLGYVAVALALVAVWSLMGWSVQSFALAMLAVHLIIGFESDTLQRLHLDRTGWHTLGAVTGKDALDCERRFFDVWLPGQPLTPVTAAGVTAAQSGRITQPAADVERRGMFGTASAMFSSRKEP